MSIASSAFRDAAATQARSLGMVDAKCVFVPHPIQDSTDAEMRAKADACVEEVVTALTKVAGAAA